MYQNLLNSNHYFQWNTDLDSSGSTYVLCIKSKLGHSIPPYFVHVHLHVEYKLDETLLSTLECIMHIKASRHSLHSKRFCASSSKLGWEQRAITRLEALARLATRHKKQPFSIHQINKHTSLPEQPYEVMALASQHYIHNDCQEMLILYLMPYLLLSLEI